MSDAMWLEGKEYISSKRASELSGYAQDYIGQLARKGLVDAQRVGGLWFIFVPSLTEYKTHADTYVPQIPDRKQPIEADSLISFDGKDHISAARASKITGYHPDYVGQLARTGAIISRQVGNRWYIDREGILAHKREKDGLLGAVQAQSVGIVRNEAISSAHAPEGTQNDPGAFFTYTRDDGELLPVLKKPPQVEESHVAYETEAESDQTHVVPIRTIRARSAPMHATVTSRKVQTPGKTAHFGTFRNLAAAALTIVIVLSFGFATLKNSSIYGVNTTGTGSIVQRNAFTAGAAEALSWIGRFLENFLVTELVYKRGQ